MTTAIAELSAERGYAATKIADVVQRAGVARKTLYDNFEGKEQLFLAAIDTAFGEIKEAVRSADAEADGVWQTRIEAGLAAFLGFVAEYPATARMCMIEAVSATPLSSARYDSALNEFVDLLRRRTPTDSDLPETVEETLIGGVAWIVIQQIRRGQAEEVMDLLPELSEFLLSPYHGVAEVGPHPHGESNSTVPDSST